MAATPSFIGTKLHPPCVRDNLVLRPRLSDLLDAGIRPECRLILISAPAGCGKTTLAATWLARSCSAHAWLSLEASENDPARFLSYLGAALETIAPEFGAYVSSLTGAPQLPGAEIVAAELINAMRPSPGLFLLALDDYHTVTHSYPHDVVRFLVQHQPPYFRLILITREDPPFPLNRMRVRNEMTEIRMDDLRFTAEEAKAFLQTMGLDLRDGAMDSCLERTEGWVAGLQLAALSLQGCNAEEAEAFLTAFGGSHRYIIDYLVDEVLNRHEPWIREFLRRTSVLDRFTPALCDEVAGRDDSREVLRRIEANNLFLIPLDGEREWFRYHHLFADSLRTEMGESERAEVHRRAAGWLEARGDLPEAVRQMLAAGEKEDAARLIAAVSAEMMLQGQLATLRDWLEALPVEAAYGNSDLAAVKPWALYLTGHIREAETFLAGMPPDRRTGLPDHSRGRLLTLEAMMAGGRGENARAANLARDALHLLDSETDPLDRVSALNTLGQSIQRLGDMSAAEEVFRESYALVAAYPRTFLSVVTVVYLSYLLDLHGRRREAETICRRHYQSLLNEEGRPPAFGGILAAQLGVLAYEADELAEARFLLETGLDLCRASSLHWSMQGEEKLALTLDALGEHEAALEVLLEAKRPNTSEDALFTSSAVEAELRRRLGETGAAWRWAEKWRLTPRDSPNMQRESAFLTYIRLLLDMGRPEQALPLIERMSARVKEERRVSRLIPLHVLHALTLTALGRREESVAIVGEAVTLAAPEGYVRAFLDQGPAVAPMLPQVRTVAPAFVDRLAAAFGSSGNCGAGKPARLPEPLTDREVELLQLLTEGLSNDEISRRLYISLNTTKWHLKSIFGKLAAVNRTQAVARARELGITG